NGKTALAGAVRDTPKGLRVLYVNDENKASVWLIADQQGNVLARGDIELNKLLRYPNLTMFSWNVASKRILLYNPLDWSGSKRTQIETLRMALWSYDSPSRSLEVVHIDLNPLFELNGDRYVLRR
ncbi:MAG TPA: hypothetical protein VL282_19095, partial [Tepidisphaeraceae bacterium]|nr:hypothetical protein [Tepidisphaeraceae bacterium]